MMTSTVRLARDYLNDSIFADEPYTEREAFLWLIIEAAWKPREVRVGAAIVKLDRGQLAASIRFMSDRWRWHRSSTDRFIKKLSKLKKIETDTETGVMRIKLCNYERYQILPTELRDTMRDRTETGPRQDRDKQERGRKEDVIRTEESVPVSESLPKRESEQVDRNPPDGGSPATKYAFEARTIRLTLGDHERWRQAFPHLSLDAELESLDAWASEQEQGGRKWFPAVANALAKRNREAMERKAAQNAAAPNGHDAGEKPWWERNFDAKGRALPGLKGYPSGRDPRL